MLGPTTPYSEANTYLIGVNKHYFKLLNNI